MTGEAKGIPFASPWLTNEDRQAVLSVLDGPILTHGPRCAAFEAAFIKAVGGGYAVTTSSCTAALHLYWMALGVGPGDEVIVPAMSHVATAHALEITGARPVFVDCDSTGNIDPTKLRDAFSPNTKAISLVHFLGMPARMREIMLVAESSGLPVLEDCAVGLGATYDGWHVGLIGDAGCFSFYPAKHITAAEGGMFLTRSKDLADKVRRLRGFHYDRSLNERALPGIYDVDGCGLNYRMSELQAALGTSQLARLDEILRIRRRNYHDLKSALSAINGIVVLDAGDPDAPQSFYTLAVLIDGASERRDRVLGFLKDRKVGTSVHYPHPLPRLAYYKNKYGYDAAKFRGAERIADHSLNLPVGPHVSPTDIDLIAKTLSDALYTS